MNKNKYIPWIVSAGLVASLVIAMPALAQTVGVSVGASGGVSAGTGSWSRGGGFRGGHGPMMPAGVFGTVTAISGTTLTVTSQPRMMRPHPMGTTTTVATPVGANASVVYTVDASNAKIYKGSATTTVSIASVATGDTVIVQGTVNGTNVTATVIRDGVGFARVPGMGGKMFGPGHGSTSTPPVSPIKGNGEPVLGGAVTAVSGTTLTIANASNVTYTVDASSATIVKNGTTTTVSSVVTGDTLVVQGTVNGTSVTASSIIDQGTKNNATSANGGGGPFHSTTSLGGIFGAIGGFFQRLFGF